MKIHEATVRLWQVRMAATVFALLALGARPVWAQSTGEQASTTQQFTPGVAVDAAHKSSDLAASVTTERNPGTTWAGYEVKQSAEFGGRLTDFTGSTAMWDTLINLGSGPRLLEYSLDLHSPDHKGFLFDDLTFSNFGYGGDPNNVSRLHIMKGKLYTFGANFRRDQNIFDYDLFANPLNPLAPASNPAVPILNSPHEYLLTRRMSDANLTLFPVGKVRLRMSWSRVVNEGSAFSSVHEGTEGLLLRPTLNTTDNFQGGISLRVIPRTSINYDQFYTYFKGDTSSVLAPDSLGAIFGLPSFTLAGGIPVNLGLAFNTPAGQPCNPVVLGTGFVNPACNGYFSYSLAGNTRNSFPTEQLSIQSNYWKRVDLSLRVNYSSAEAAMPSFTERFSGLITRTRQRTFSDSGGSLTHRFSLSGDFAVSVRVTDKLRLVDSFRYYNFRIPSSWAFTTVSFFGATLLSTPNTFSPATCPPPFTAATCPQHNASSSPDVSTDFLFDFLRQDQKLNTFQVEYDITPRITAYAGFRHENREITHNVTDFAQETFFPGPTAALANRGDCSPAASHPLNPDGSCSTVGVVASRNEAVFVPINSNSLLGGFSARPTDQLRASFDFESFYADNAYTRVSPRHLNLFRFRANYNPKNGAFFGSSILIQEGRNTTADIGHKDHNHSYAFSAGYMPSEARWGVDLSYDYNDVFSTTNICFVATPTPSGALSCGTPFLSGTSIYKDQAHNASGSLYLKPIKRVTAGVGYTVTSTSGTNLIINPNAPTGPQAYLYHLPSASLAIELSKSLTYKTGWNYFDYNEKSAVGPTLPRDFRGNVFTLSLRYTM
jgi:hypothetical protein